MQENALYAVGLMLGGAVAGAAFGFVPLILGFVLKERSAGWRSFFVCIFIGAFGGLKILGYTFAITLLPILKAHKDKKQALAQQGIQPDGPASGGSAS